MFYILRVLVEKIQKLVRPRSPLPVLGVLFLMIPARLCAQFPDHIAVGPAASLSYSKEFTQVRMSGRIHIPGDFVDIETDPASLSAFLDREVFNRLGVSWLSLVWVPPFVIGAKVPVLKRMSLLLMGLSGLLNANAGIGNSWIRGTLGWKNDIFLYRDFLWVVSPEIGCKVSLPRGWITPGAVRMSVEFPTIVGTYRDSAKDRRNFGPRFAIGVDVMPIYGEICLRGK